MVHIDLQNQNLKKQHNVLSAPFILDGNVNIEQDDQSGDHKPNLYEWMYFQGTDQ